MRVIAVCVLLLIAACTSSEGGAREAKSPLEAARRYLAAVAGHDQAAALSVLEPKFKGHPFALDPHALGYSGRVLVTDATLLTGSTWQVGTSLVAAGARSPGPTFAVIRNRSGTFLINGYIVHG
jgi:hypothetical protein